jgi:hypothetical protein
MSDPHDRKVAATLLRLLLDGDPSAVSEETEWDSLLRVGVSNSVGIRAVDRLRAAGFAIPAGTAQIVEDQRRRAGGMLDTMARVGELCRSRGILFCYPKALLHLPDAGRDIDLLVGTVSLELDGLLVRELGAERLTTGLGARISGSTQYRIRGCEAVVDIHHGRLGLVGEHVQFPRDLVRRCRAITVGTSRFQVPTREDQLVLQGMQRVYGRTGIRLADVVSTMTLLRASPLDWDHVIKASLQEGTLPGLSCYLSYLEGIHAEVFGKPLPAAPQGRALVRPGWGRLRFAENRYRFPTVAINCRLYLERLVSDLVARKWSSAARLTLLPAMAGDRVARRLRRAATAAHAPIS